MTMDLQLLSDHAEITDLINRYGKAVAERDVEIIVGLFTDDAVLDFHGQPDLVRGEAAIREQFTGSFAPPGSAPAALALDVHVVSTPLMTNLLVDIEGDGDDRTAQAESYCLAVHAGVRADEGRVLMRATRNVDDLRHTPDGWRITRRRHEKVWTADVPGECGFTHRGDT